MIDWSGARQAVQEVFFEDEFTLHQAEEAEDEIGEVSEAPGDSLGNFAGNIQYQPISKEQQEQGVVTPQNARVSTVKGIGLVRGERYFLKIVSARVEFDANEYWEVVDWVEGQLSTVVTLNRRQKV